MENILGNKDMKPEGVEGEATKCPRCGAGVKGADEFCGECGTRVRQTGMSGAQKLWNEEVDASVRKASKWILVLGFLFLVFGTFMGFLQKETRDTAITNLAQYEDSMTWSEPVNGKTVTVGELRKMVDFEYYAVFGMNYFLAVVMFVIFYWSKTSPFSAFVTALSIYFGVMVLNAVVDPKTIAQGIIVKIFVIAALVNGIKAAIPTRGLARGSL